MTSTNSATIQASPADVWAVLADGWFYPVWVVGASRMRAVDEGWPAVGCRLHHSVGSWPLLIDDTTEVTHCEPETELALQARAWPSGEASIRITLEPTDDGATVVTMEEDVTHGPARLILPAVRRLALDVRNTESLRRLTYITEGRHR